MNTSDLFATIEAGLNTVSIAGEEAHAALTTLRQRVADLETFYQHMVGADYQDKLMHKMNAAVFQANCSAVSLRNWKEYDALLERLSDGT